MCCLSHGESVGNGMLRHELSGLVSWKWAPPTRRSRTDPFPVVPPLISERGKHYGKALLSQILEYIQNEQST